MVMPTAEELIESTAVALAGGPEEWPRYGAVIQDQYRVMAQRAVAHLMEVAAGLAAADEELAAALLRMAEEAAAPK